MQFLNCYQIFQKTSKASSYPEHDKNENTIDEKHGNLIPVKVEVFNLELSKVHYFVEVRNATTLFSKNESFAHQIAD